ncbi:MAG: DUF4190 domain-containing protein [Phycisphaerales bacterium]|nr:DUF4190 domain-containing protein [Phycisphaerales bacterium]
MNANNLDVESFDSEIAAPQRTSILAILSLVCSLICLIPGTGVLAAIFGISALVGIRGSRGRVGGTGLAIAGLIVGLLFTMVWIGIAVGMNALMQEFTGKLVAPMNQAIIAMDAGDNTKLREALLPDVNNAVSDQQIADFRSAYQAELGSCKGMPTQVWDFFSAYMPLKDQMQPLQGRNDMIPLPVNFDKGPALVVLWIRTQGGNVHVGPQGEDRLPFKNVTIYTTTGKEFSLLPLEKSLVPTPAPADPALPPPAPEAPAEKPGDASAKEGDK